jgi:hypothetical protein
MQPGTPQPNRDRGGALAPSRPIGRAALLLAVLLAFTATPAVVESHAQTHVGSAAP